MAKTENTIPNMLAVSRAIQYSNGVMLACKSVSPDECIPIPVITSSCRGSKFSYSDAYAVAKKDGKKTKDINTPNIQAGDSAFLPFGYDTLNLSFSMNVLAVSTDRQACNSLDYSQKMAAFLDAFSGAGGFSEMARLIIWRLANASALWRNRYGTNKRVRIIDANAGEWAFESDELSTISPETFSAPADLTSKIADALSGKAPVLMLNVQIYVTLGDGQEVFPSQEMEMGGGKQKNLYSIDYRGQQTAAMHPQKIGAAIRSFDIWHDGYSDYGPLPMEPLGFSHTYQTTFRAPATKADLYSHLLRIDELTEELKSTGLNHSALHMAGCLMRGGVYSGPTDK